MSESSDEDGELGGRDGAGVFFVEDGEEFLVVDEFFFAQVF